MNDELKELILQWYEKAENDIDSAKLIIDHKPSILNVPCFLCQQCVEKYLKAFLVYKEKDLVKTHNLNFLLEECISFDPDFAELQLKELNNFAVDIRYPDDVKSPELSEVLEYIELAEQIKQLVISKIKFD